MPLPAPARAAAVVVLGVALLLTGCGGDDKFADAEQTTPATETTSSAPPSTAPPSSSAATFDGTEVVVAVEDGKVSPPTRRVEVGVGTDVRLVITSDTADEVHVHGYDLEQDLPAGKRVTLEFTADQAGLFEVEAHESGLQLVQLEVR